MNDRFIVKLNVAIRSCQQEDLPNLEWFGLYSSSRELLAKAFDRYIKGENMMLVAEVNHFPIGQIWIDLVKRRTESIGVLWALRVMPPLQNLGIGTHLITAAERYLQEQGFHKVEIGVEKDNPDAKRLYERLGYQVVGDNREEWNYTSSEGQPIHMAIDEWIMIKSLTA